MKRLIAMCTMFLLTGHVNAAVIYSTFGPEDRYDMSIGYSIGWYDLDQGNQFSFGDTTSYYLDTIEIAAALSHGANELDLWLMSDDAGQPGAIIEAFHFTNAMGPFGWIGGFNPLLVGNSVSHPILSPGTNYWLIASAPLGTDAAWNESLPAVSGLRAVREGAGSWIISTWTMAAFRINGEPVSNDPNVIPAPGAILLGSIGVGFVSWLKRRKTL